MPRQSVAPSSQSLTGQIWSENAVDPEPVNQISEACDIPEVAAKCLVLRGWDDVEHAQRALAPQINDLHDPYDMLGMTAAVTRIRQAVAQHEKIRIVTDYDVDGTTSSLILQATLTLLGVAPDKLDYHIPDRFNEGYGFSVEAAKRAVKDDVSLLLTADIGVRDQASVAAAADGGIDVIICDHHLPDGESVPERAYAVLCPPQLDCDYPNPALAACGVSLKLAQALLDTHAAKDVMIRSLMKLAAIGTVADVVDLATPENRAIVTLGLQSLSQGPNNAGLQALLDIAGCSGRTVTAEDCGFRLGPRINAAGRLEHAGIAVDLLLERDPAKANALASEIEALNQARKQMQEDLVQRALQALPDPLPAFPLFGGTAEEGWHKGLSGIIASKLKEALHRPVGVYAIGPDDYATASVRSIPAVHAVQALDASSDLLEKYGGHPVAAGFTVHRDRLTELQSHLSDFAKDCSTSLGQAPERHYDATASASTLNLALAKCVERLGPFGKGNAAPIFRVVGVRTSGVRTLNNKHLKFDLGPGVSAIWWRAAEHRSALVDTDVELIGRLEINRWQGRTSAQIVVEDAIVSPQD